ncbi:MAG TPA: Gfo/Idh/MocA family oxidoreductase [Acidimicrobiales bacterium]|nr:Gfo/Idh/MocA family oxidoreductase [Acidimicrobiales bacterium]
MTVRWGIAGTGGIAARFVEALRQTPDAELVAVGSRTDRRADAFADEWGIPRRHGDYDDLAADEDVDVVYVATPQSRHADDACRYLDAGKHVLCEKPMAMTEAEVLRMTASAGLAERFLMEAIWSRFLPSYVTLWELLLQGRIGEPLLVESDFGFRMPVDASHRLFDPARGGGALLDLGIYPLQLASWVLGPPDGVAAVGHVGETDVDETVVATLHHPGGRLGVAKASIRVNLPCTGRIVGSEGTIELPAMMHCPESLVVRDAFGQAEELARPIEGEGLRYQVTEVHRCIAEGLPESPVMTLAESARLAATMDQIRDQIDR